MFESSVKIKDVKLEIGELIRSSRKEKKISQGVLADQLDLSRVTIQNLESGKNFTIDTLLKALQYFELLESLNQLLIDKRNERENLTSLY
ncbi:MAG: helix-turn-helix domain-containing protein [Crocinitomicaceae bacterium]|nr:helix-turn-helix domain-containing protein [Crocinitomicaceae bacterium]